MEKPIIRQSSSNSDLEGILQLQRENLLENLNQETIQKEGFVRVKHSLEDLENLQKDVGHVIAVSGDQVAAYILAMTKQSRDKIPMLLPMFEQFDSIQYQGQLVSDFNYMAVGQVCVGKDYRGLGLFAEAYRAYRDFFKPNYYFAITEISLNNKRSLRAHEKVGFKIIHTFKDQYEEWAIVLWDW
ncbi:GNAT family N-acetyltransferase [Algoriphagus sp. PAP.12]|uniref:GNAT family N-acetyltransferase n=1 Tax=Algoriphagus sp. PAP.12 TaxID=2996678 RepID=UPI00227B0C1A|nr:GNAT family N-acetyltransferase [Algoriphagus sp. PAP.12]